MTAQGRVTGGKLVPSALRGQPIQHHFLGQDAVSPSLSSSLLWFADFPTIVGYYDSPGMLGHIVPVGLPVGSRPPSEFRALGSPD